MFNTNLTNTKDAQVATENPKSPMIFRWIVVMVLFWIAFFLLWAISPAVAILAGVLTFAVAIIAMVKRFKK